MHPSEQTHIKNMIHQVEREARADRKTLWWAVRILLIIVAVDTVIILSHLAAWWVVTR